MNIIETLLGIDPEFQKKLIASLIGILFAISFRWFALRILNRRIQDPRILYAWRKWVGYISYGIAIFALGRPWIPELQDISTFLGIVTAGLAVALKEPLVDLVGWVFILSRKPMQVGDRIQIGSHTGDVIDIRIFHFTLMEVGNWVDADQSTGRVIHIPNGRIFHETVANYSRGFQYLWHEIPVLITFDSDWERAKQIFLTIANQDSERLSAAAQARLQEAAQNYMIVYSKLTPTVYTSVKESGILLTIRYLCEPRQRRSTEEAIWEDILRTVDQEEKIAFAYPTHRLITTVHHDAKYPPSTANS
ncbi:mechanosensitive ion channel family protein [Acaryochloris sp. CCMEE 5410]|uniref:mechanosensitive ion channel family protein n=1 Tax=Acaryochloris sp. CCMEE 5410 TaxID=310037 RepID=UPI0002483CBB|nr:mechanosensitive ion channel family protein [Acaryochloris sp. CCMEE 5410]KAI9134401.1 mechanosensitive ion channel family protein [Acaryochloris sp. CCMEE 5410]